MSGLRGDGWLTECRNMVFGVSEGEACEVCGCYYSGRVEVGGDRYGGERWGQIRWR